MAHLALILALLTLAVGVVLGLRFRVLILIPAIACGLPLGFAIGLARTEAIGPAIVMAATALAGLQIGYLTGAIFRYGVGTERLSRPLSPLWDGSQTPRGGVH
jgi:hypothetical protein